jgi:lambda family phage portal protein
MIGNWIKQYGAKLRAKQAESQYRALLFDTAYRGASLFSRQMRSWRPAPGSASRDYSFSEQVTLVSRCRDAYRNQPLARAAIERLEQTIVGPGIELQSKIDGAFLGIDDAALLDLEQQVERLWDHFCGHCDYERQLTFNQICKVLATSWLASGDCFVNTPFVENPGDLFGLKLQLVEADRVCNPSMTADVQLLRRGVEFSKTGGILAYHVMRSHPHDDIISVSDWQWDRILAYGQFDRRFLHLWNKERPGQVRGIPFLAPVLEQLAQLDRYAEAELQATVVSALLTVFVKSEGGGLPSSSFATNESGRENEVKSNEIALQPGAIVDLMPGEDIAAVNPARPNRAFGDFVEACYKQIGAALGVPMESLLMRYDSSYSAARAAMAVGWRKVMQMRNVFVHQVCKPIYGNFMDEVVSRGLIEHPSLKHYYTNPLVRDAWLRASWSGPARGAIDEEKEIRAAQSRIAIGVSTIQRECEEMGHGDWLDLHVQRKFEHKVRVAAGLEPEILVVGDEKPPKAQGSDISDVDTDAKEDKEALPRNKNKEENTDE